MRVERLVPEWASKCAEIERECLSTPWTESQILDTCSDEHACYLVALEEEEPIGILCFYSVCGEASINNLAVTESARRRGAAGELLLFAEQLARRSGNEKITLEVDVSNTGAITLYKKHGYTAVGIRRGFYHGSDAYTMEKRL